MDGVGDLWTANVGKGALEGLSRACVNDSGGNYGCNHSFLN